MLPNPLSLYEANLIRTFRKDGGYTWRKVAEQVALMRARIRGETTQEYGMKLCTEAAVLLGENPDGEGWN